MTRSPRSAHPLLRAAGTLVLVAGAGAAAVGLSAALHARTGPAALTAAEAAIPVETAALRLEDAYAVETRHLGRVEAARAVALAFDLGGRVEAVLVEEGDRVAPGQALARLDVDRLEARLAELDAEVAALEARAELSRRTLARQETLRERGHATEQRLDEARLELERLGAERARLDAARDSVRLDLGDAVLRAPFAGEIAARHVHEGAVAAAGAPALELVEVDRPRIRLGLPARLAAGLAAEDLVEVEIDGAPRVAVVAAVRPDLDPATRTRAVLLDLMLPAGERVAFGGTAEAILEETREERGAWIPLTALREGERGLWTVMTVAAEASGPVARPESVEVLHLAGERAYVRGSFADGARAILSGPHRVVSGDPVAPRPAAGPRGRRDDLLALRR